MARDCKIEFLIQNPPDDQYSRTEKLVETLIDQLIPRIAETMEIVEDELVARLMVELAHVIGVTHTPDSALSMISMISDAMLSGQQAVLDLAEADTGIDRDDKAAASDYDNGDWIHQCSSVRH